MLSLKDFSKNCYLQRFSSFNFTYQAKQNKTKRQPQIKQDGGGKDTEDRKTCYETIRSAVVHLTSTWDTTQRVNCILPYSNYALANVPCMTAVSVALFSSRVRKQFFRYMYLETPTHQFPENKIRRTKPF